MEGGGEEVSIEELSSNLSTYREQLQEVRKLLKDDPVNFEYADVEKELVEFETKQYHFYLSHVQNLPKVFNFSSLYCCQVIALTEELLATAHEESNNSGPGIGTTSAVVSPTFHNDPVIHLCIDLIRHAIWNQVSSEMYDGHRIPIGTQVQAVYSEDGEWYDARIEAHTPNGYMVAYSGWGNKEEVDPANVRAAIDEEEEEGNVDPLLEAEKEAEATKLALKRKIAQAAATSDLAFQSKTLPAKLRIEPEDPEDVKAAKRKKIHAFKSKMRKEQIEVTQNKRQNAWQQFQTTKGRAKKIGFFSGRKKESIFKSPDDPFGKVGVTGSGKGLTDFQKREKHLHLKGANAENTEE
ncbi:hypothetical protein LXL04_039070 [Taraxacum kok-saghyz]